MTRTDILLEYQKETGKGLVPIKDTRESVRSSVYCQHCDETSDMRMDIPEDLEEYIQWLESIAISYFLSAKVQKKFDAAIHGTKKEAKDPSV